MPSEGAGLLDLGLRPRSSRATPQMDSLRSVFHASEGAGLLDLRPTASVFESDPSSGLDLRPAASVFVSGLLQRAQSSEASSPSHGDPTEVAGTDGCLAMGRTFCGLPWDPSVYGLVILLDSLNI